VLILNDEIEYFAQENAKIKDAELLEDVVGFASDLKSLQKRYNGLFDEQKQLRTKHEKSAYYFNSIDEPEKAVYHYAQAERTTKKLAELQKEFADREAQLSKNLDLAGERAKQGKASVSGSYASKVALLKEMEHSADASLRETIRETHWGLLIIFILVELLPIFNRMAIERNVYTLLREEEEAIWETRTKRASYETKKTASSAGSNEKISTDLKNIATELRNYGNTI